MEPLSTRLFRVLPLAALTLSALIAVTPPAAAAPEAVGAVRTLYATLLQTMRGGPSLGAQGRYARIMPVINQVFDVELMTRISVGPAWSGLSPAQRQQATEAFARYIAAVYADRFDSYAGERLEVTGTQPTSAGQIVNSVIVKSDGEQVHINYLMRQTATGWRIADVYLNGTISELATRRSEFAAILRSSGIDGLIATLNGKAAALASARTS
jgi:phospholipid transport system substrate-binding protein